MRKGHSKLAHTAALVAFALACFSESPAQDGSGRSGAATKPSAPAVRRAGRRSVPPRPSRTAAAPAPKRVELGKLTIFVSEGDSRIEISRVDDPDAPPQVVNVPAGAESLVVRTLPEGTYRVAVTKYGYEDEAAEVTVTDGNRRRVSFALKPKLAVLNVAVSIPDSRIEIENVGAYEKQVNRLYLPPGRYRVHVTRRGYAPQTVVVDIAAPGREESIRVLMLPHRIDDVLDEAGENLANGNFTLAGELAGDVLRQNPAHARANLIYGSVELRRGADATPYLLRAVLGGETLRFPVKLQDSKSMSLVDGVLILHRDAVSAKSAGPSGIDHTFPRGGLEVLNFSPRPSPGFISLTGRADLHGRTVNAELKIHPHDIVVDAPIGTTRCGTSGCERAVTELARLLEAWHAANP